MEYDLLIRNGTTVSGSGRKAQDVAVSGGKIAALLPAGSGAAAAREIDARGLFVLPGLIDAHVHFRTPGLEYKEDFFTGSRAAVHGGVTAVLDMPNVKPVTSTAARLRERQALAAAQGCLVNIGFYALLTNDNLGEMDALQDAGAVGYKIFLGTSTGNVAAPGDGVMLEQFRKAAQQGLRIALHAENNDVNAYFSDRLRAAGVTTADCLDEARPAFSEFEAVCRALAFAYETGAKIHICHVSAAKSVAAIRMARKAGVDVTAETAPQYLLLNNSAYRTKGPRIKAFPTIKTEQDRLALWEGLADGTISLIATDHAPHTKEEKQGNIWTVTGGIAGVEICARLLLTEVNRGALTLEKFVSLLSEEPARVWNLSGRGALREGLDANITVVDLAKEAVLHDDELHGKNNVTAFDGTPVKGAPVLTVVNGKVYEV